MSSPSKRVAVLDDLEDDSSNARSHGAGGDDAVGAAAADGTADACGADAAVRRRLKSSSIYSYS